MSPMYLAFMTATALTWFQTVHAVSHELPAHYPHCKRFDPDLNGCLLRATETIRPLMKKGLTEFNVPSIEPLTLPAITLEQGTDALNFKAVLNNIVISGLGNYKFSKFDFDIPTMRIYAKATIDNLSLEGDYTIEGRILIAPVRGRGKFTSTIKNGEFEYFEQAEVITKNKKEYLHPKSTNVTINVSEPTAKLDGLFDGNEVINKVTNQVIEDNIQILMEDFKPTIEKVIGTVIKDLIFKNLINNVPFDKLYEPVAP